MTKISDGFRTLDVLPLQGIIHDGNLLVAYLPTEKILINADMYSPPATNAQQIPKASIPARELLQNIKRLNFNVERHVPIHGQVGTHEMFLRVVGQATNWGEKSGVRLLARTPGG